jgi:hypothetical protein
MGRGCAGAKEVKVNGSNNYNKSNNKVQAFWLLWRPVTALLRDDE